MPGVAKASRVFAILLAMEAAFLVILPWWQVFAGEADGVISFIACTLLAVPFAIGAVILHLCYRHTHKGTHSQFAETLVWLFVSVTGFIGSVIPLSVLWQVAREFLSRK